MTLTLAGSHANVTYIHEAMSLTTSARLPLVHLPGAAIFSSCANIPDALGCFLFFFADLLIGKVGHLVRNLRLNGHEGELSAIGGA